MLLGFADDSTPGERRRVGAVLAVAVLAVSSAAVLVVALDDVDPLAKAFWRTVLVAVLLAPGIRRVGPGDLARIGLAGVCLAGHFGAWFASLAHTSVLRSTLLVCLAPVWTGLLEWVFLRRRPSGWFWAGIAVAAPGAAVMGIGDNDPATLLGDGLALLGGVLGAIYWVVGRSVRQRVGIGTYGSLVCVAAAIVLLVSCVGTGTALWGWGAWSWGGLVALAVGPQMFGHNGFNYALRYLPAATVTAITLMEPIGATLLAWALLGQQPTVWAGLGALLVLAGVVTAVALGSHRAR